MIRLVLMSLALVGCGGTAPPATPTPAPVETPEATPAPQAKAAPTAVASVERGAEVFATNCASCHGADGRGGGAAAAALDPKPADLRGPRAEHLRGIPRRQIIEEGRPGTAMIGWKAVLSAEDLDAVYAYVHDMHHGPGGR